MKTGSGLLTWVLWATFLCAVSSQAITLNYSNATSDGLWTTWQNWDTWPLTTNATMQIPDDPQDIAYIIQSPTGPDNQCNLDTNITVRSIRSGYGSQGGVAELYSSGGYTLTISGIAENNPGFRGESGPAGGRLLINCDVVVSNAFGNQLTQVVNYNSASNTVEFGTNSTLTLLSPLVTLNGNAGTTIEFNGTLSSNSTAFLIIESANASFNAGHDSSAFSPEIVFYSNAKLAVNGGTVLSSGNKFQFNGNNDELELNGANAINGANMSVAVANNMLIDANSDQNNLGWLEFGDGTVTLDLDAAVTNLWFADSSLRTWGFGSMVISNFMSEVVRFGTTAGGLAGYQLAAISAYDAAGVLVPDLNINTNGYLTGTITTDTPTTKYAGWAALYPTLADTNMTYDAEPDGVVNLMEYALGGNPTNDDAAVILPVSSLVEADGTNWLQYVYNRRLDAAERGLTYAVLSGTELTVGLAFPTEEVGSGAFNEDFESVTNRISTATEDHQFMDLFVEFTN